MAADERRSAIIAATIPLLRTRGWTVTTKEIRTAAQVSDGTIFSVFETKEELLLAALEAALDPQPALDRLAGIDPALPLEQRLLEAIEVLQGLATQIWDMMTTLQLEEVRGRMPQRWTAENFVRDILPPLFEPSRAELGVEPAVASQALLALTLGGANPIFFKNPLRPAEIVAVLLGGIGRPPA